MRLWHEMRCTRRSSPRDVRDLTLAVMRLLLDEIRLRPPASPWLRDVRATIAANPAAPLGLKRLADQAGVHPGHLTRAFRASYGMTPRSYQRRCRIDLACRALGESLTPLAEIAIDVGYAEQSSFTRSFQQMTGMTPLSFRRQARLDSAERDVRFGQDTDSTLQ
jgi:AraC-like DNA-binding protein